VLGGTGGGTGSSRLSLGLWDEIAPAGRLGLPDDTPVIQSHQVRGDKRQPLGEDGMTQRLFAKAGLEGFKGHDLRRTFSSLVTEASCATGEILPFATDGALPRQRGDPSGLPHFSSPLR